MLPQQAYQHVIKGQHEVLKMEIIVVGACLAGEGRCSGDDEADIGEFPALAAVAFGHREGPGAARCRELQRRHHVGGVPAAAVGHHEITLAHPASQSGREHLLRPQVVHHSGEFRR